MGIVVLSTPDKAINGIQSDVNAVNQLRYEMKREDDEIASVANNSGDAQLVFSSTTDYSSNFTAGHKIYFGADSVYTSGVYTVKSVTFATNTKVTINLDYSATATGYINRLTDRVNHNIEVGIYEETGTTLIISKTYHFSGNQAGEIVFDIGDIIKGYLVSNDLTFVTYLAKYRQRWLDVDSSFDTYTTIGDILAVRGALFDADGGSNLVNYLMKLAGSNYDTWVNIEDGGDDWTDVGGTYECDVSAHATIPQSDYLGLDEPIFIAPSSDIDLAVTFEMEDDEDLVIHFYVQDAVTDAWTEEDTQIFVPPSAPDTANLSMAGGTIVNGVKNVAIKVRQDHAGAEQRLIEVSSLVLQVDGVDVSTWDRRGTINKIYHSSIMERVEAVNRYSI